MADADVVLIHGASLHGDLLIPKTILFLAYLAKTRYHAPVVIANHTADLANPALRRIAESVYPLFDDVVFRDPLSAEKLSSLCDGRYAGDTAFWFEPSERAPWDEVTSRFGYFDVWPDRATSIPPHRTCASADHRSSTTVATGRPSLRGLRPPHRTPSAGL